MIFTIQSMRNSLHSAVLLITCLILGFSSISRGLPALTWISVNVDSPAHQGDAHLLRAMNGKIVLIDGGAIEEAKETLLPLLGKEKVSKIDAVFITHPHFDHYGGIIALLENRFPIGKIYLYPIKKEFCERESPWGCIWKDVLRLRKLADENQVPIEDYSVFSRYSFYKDVYLEKLLQAPAGAPSVTKDINDTSLIAALHIGKTKVLFPGDLNRALSNWILKKHPGILPATILKAPHHGTESNASDEFYTAVGAELTVVPSPSGLWCSERSKRIRNAILNSQSKVLVNGVHGHIRISFKADGTYDVDPKPVNVEDPCQGAQFQQPTPK